MQIRYVILLIIFCAISNNSFAQNDYYDSIAQARGYSLKFGNDSLIAHIFWNDYNDFLYLKKDSTFLFSKCMEEDTTCACLCVTGKWTLLSRRDYKKSNFIQNIFGKKHYNSDSLIIKLTEEKRTPVYPSLPWNVSIFNEYSQIFNDTLIIYFYSQNSSRVQYGQFRKIPWGYIDPAPDFFKKTRKVTYWVAPFDPDYSRDVTKYLVKKYNLEIDYTYPKALLTLEGLVANSRIYQRYRGMNTKYAGMITADFFRLISSYRFARSSQEGGWQCSCFEYLE